MNQQVERLVVIFSIFFFFVRLSLPLACIWAVNKLFHTGIAFTFGNWLAAACLLLTLRMIVAWKREVGIKESTLLRAFNELFGKEEEDDDDDDYDYDDDDDDIATVETRSAPRPRVVPPAKRTPPR